MKLLIRKIIIYLISLSLTGLPMFTFAQDMSAVDHSKKAMHSEKAVAKTASDPSLMRMPCHAESNKYANKSNQVSQQFAPPEKKAPSDIHASHVSNDACCADGCQCKSGLGCRSVHNSNTSAILQFNHFFSSPLSSRLVSETVVFSYDFISDSDIIPPIA